ncbi:phospholipase B1, membrane-associated-like isoform X1 [Frieseomelitta varia]|uniref:phospholipase B1, membrane-associated-like isoform X1 n=1 Tax=Frieseomelitta varia TaxID=561572 RepID=UPI001CB6A51B|nr:phospholipase B1, membrane-associated-like isoform X1 [Frieseomelitta varia]
MDTFRFYLLLQLCVLAVSQKTALDSPINLYFYRQVRNWLVQNFGMRNEERSFPTRNLEMAQEEVSKDTPFPCNVTGGRSPEIPESVHRLRPGDIDVIAAMGDSLTAGAGLYATNLLEVFVENRGASAFIGGQGTWRTHMTLPNILKEFNPKLIGYAYGDSLTTQSPSQLDVAEIGAMSRDMPFMAKYLVRRIKNDSRIDVKRHWKLISLFIGSNDFCADICTFSSPWSILDNHKLDLINTFKILRDNLPRTLVVLHIIPHLKELVAARKGKNFLKCYLTTTFGCPCLLALQFRDQRQEYYEILQRWQEIDEEVADYPEFHRNDFTIVVSPVLKHTKLPRTEDGHTDLSYLSADCFHLSQKSNARLANNVWNTLLEPVNNKTSTWNPLYEKFACPTTERPFLMTRENSKGINEVKG